MIPAQGVQKESGAGRGGGGVAGDARARAGFDSRHGGARPWVSVPALRRPSSMWAAATSGAMNLPWASCRRHLVDLARRR